MASPTTHRVSVDLGLRSYGVVIGSGVRAQLADFLREELRPSKAMVVSDRDLWPTIEPLMTPVFDQARVPWVVHRLWPGETSKSIKGVEGVLDSAIVERLDTQSVVVACGGGVVGDVAGLAASLLMRGIDWVQMPTTLLGQVDSAIGGKVSINHTSGKNLIGHVHQPRAVYCDLDFLTPLPARQWKNGFAEMLKYGFIADRALLEDLAAWSPDFPPHFDRDALALIVARCVAIKAQCVSLDERERAMRLLLYFGHTFGHAFELAVNSGRLLHGEAVARGMRIAIEVSRMLDRLSDDEAAEGRAILDRFFEPTLPAPVNGRKMLDLIQADPRHCGAHLNFIALRALGQGEVLPLPLTWLKSHIDELLAIVGVQPVKTA